MQWMMLQADDFVIATGEQISVREFVKLSTIEAGIEFEFKSKEFDDVGIIKSITGNNAPVLAVVDVIVRVEPRY